MNGYAFRSDTLFRYESDTLFAPEPRFQLRWLRSEFLKGILAHFLQKPTKTKMDAKKVVPFYDDWTHEYDSVTILYVQAFNELFPLTKKAPCTDSYDNKAHYLQSKKTTNYWTEILDKAWEIECLVEQCATGRSCRE